MTERMHPQDLRAIVAGCMFGLPRVDPDEAIAMADRLLAELERTAPEETPVTAKYGSTTFFTPGAEAEMRFVPNTAPPCPECGCRWAKGWHSPDCPRLAPAPAPTRTCSHVDETAPVTEDGKRDLRRSILCRIPAGEMEDIRAEVDRLKAELAQAKKDLVMGPCLEVITHEHVAQAVREERERLKPWLRHDENCSGDHASMPCKCGLRAALEPKPEVPCG